MALPEPKKPTTVSQKIDSDSAKPRSARIPLRSRKPRHSSRSTDLGDARATKALTNSNWRQGRADEVCTPTKPSLVKRSILSEVSANDRHSIRHPLETDSFDKENSRSTNTGLYKILKQLEIKGLSDHHNATRIIQVSSLGNRATDSDTSSLDDTSSEGCWARIQPFRMQGDIRGSTISFGTAPERGNSMDVNVPSNCDEPESPSLPAFVHPPPGLTSRRNISFQLQKSVCQLKKEPSDILISCESPQEQEPIPKPIEPVAIDREARDAQFMKLLEKLKASSVTARKPQVSERRHEIDSSVNSNIQQDTLRIPTFGSGRRHATVSDEGLYRRNHHQFSSLENDVVDPGNISSSESKGNTLNPKAREFLSFSAQPQLANKIRMQRKSVRGLFEQQPDNTYQTPNQTDVLKEPKVAYPALQQNFMPNMIVPQYATLPLLPTYYPPLVPANLAQFVSQPMANLLLPVSGQNSLPIRLNPPVTPFQSPTKSLLDVQPALKELLPLQTMFAPLQAQVQQQPVQLPQYSATRTDTQSLPVQPLAQAPILQYPTANVAAMAATQQTSKSGSKTKPSSVPKPRVPDAMGQQAYEAWIEWRKANEPGYALECKMRQQRRSQKLKLKKASKEADQGQESVPAAA
ncbi:hypothetical protein VHEMI02585 [[Torrubiella] hemipterigena]|uniref:Uncharacterized protein n=1 Tax=[Torrubiella] hemipterigena TaxID=1531966 RepID=A0A0A1SW75_9HYPO|nr:hypothetical protein VHEMI02585 [[Torrubiella] hemipterigena]